MKAFEILIYIFLFITIFLFLLNLLIYLYQQKKFVDWLISIKDYETAVKIGGIEKDGTRTFKNVSFFYVFSVLKNKCDQKIDPHYLNYYRSYRQYVYLFFLLSFIVFCLACILITITQ